MKKIRRPLFWAIGILLIIISIGGYGQGDFVWATFWLIIGIILLPPVREKLFYKKQNQPSIAQPVSTFVTQPLSETQTQQKISFEDVFKVSSGATGKN